MNNCEMIEKGLCTGCVGLAERDWIGKEKCEIYKDLKKIKGITVKTQKGLEFINNKI